MKDLLLADMYRAAEELAYLNAPVECRVSHEGLRFLRTTFALDPTKPTPPPSLVGGLRVIVDPTLPVNRMEFRDRAGNVTDSIDLPLS